MMTVERSRKILNERKRKSNYRERVYDLAKNGMSIKDISDTVGCSYNLARSYYHEWKDSMNAEQAYDESVERTEYKKDKYSWVDSMPKASSDGEDLNLDNIEDYLKSVKAKALAKEDEIEPVETKAEDDYSILYQTVTVRTPLTDSKITIGSDGDILIEGQFFMQTNVTDLRNFVEELNNVLNNHTGHVIGK